MKVCTTNGLQPTLLEAGLEGLWTPTLVPRIGYCEYNCTLCGQVCPTSAIKSLSIEEKKVWKIGIAYIDENRCIPFSMKTECLVCEEFCPIPEKAIVFRKVGGIRRPFVMEPLCIGCGACEAKCPLPDPAIVVINRDHKSQVNLPFY
jgi:formate hydrogenlyase subunit 6/NADH:ubiquinone oxidoreductase subunit I